MYIQFLRIHPTSTLPLLSPLLHIRTSNPPLFNNQFTPTLRTHFFFRHHNQQKLRPLILCAANSGSSKNWEKWVRRNWFDGDKLFKWISEATSSPIAQYISSPTTFLHSVDTRIKLAWLIVLVVLPARSHISVRFGLVIFLALLSISMQP